MGIFEWQLTVIGGTSSPVSCPYGPPAANATRPCGGNFTTGGMWKSPDVSLCKFKSERTNKLNNIAKVGHYFNISVVTLTMEQNRGTTLKIFVRGTMLEKCSSRLPICKLDYWPLFGKTSPRFSPHGK